MLLSSRMASIPSSARHAVTHLKDLQPPIISYQSSQTTASLQYFNIRVTERLHRYRSLKRQRHSSNRPNSRSESPLQNIDIGLLTREQTIDTKMNDVKDSSSTITKDSYERSYNEFNSSNNRAQHDLVQLRRIMKSRSGKSLDPTILKINSRPLGIPTTVNYLFDDHDNKITANIRKSSSVSRTKPIERVKTTVFQTRPATFPQNHVIDMSINSRRNTPSACSQNSRQPKPRQQNTNKFINIYRNRVLPCPSSDYLAPIITSARKIPSTPPKTISNPNIKSVQTLRIPTTPPIKRKQSSHIKRADQPVPNVSRTVEPEEITNISYTYAACTSSTPPRSMVHNRNTSLLPILLGSSCCLGIKQKQRRFEESNEPNDDYQYFLDYKRMTDHLPKPVISTNPHYNKDEYAILLDQLDHIRETMPDVNVYENYSRFQ